MRKYFIYGRIVNLKHIILTLPALVFTLMFLSFSPVVRASDDPYNEKAVEYLIDAYRELNGDNREKAAELAAEAARYDKKSVYIVLFRAEIIYGLGRVDEVVDLLEPIIDKAAAGDSRAHKLLAAAYQSRNENDQAMAHYSKSLTLAPDDEWVRRRFVELLVQMGRLDESIPVYKPLVAEGTENYAFDCYMMGELYFRVGDRKSSRDYLIKSLAADSAQADSYKLLGRIDQLEQRWENALINYLHCLELSPDESEQLMTPLMSVALRAAGPIHGTSENKELPDSSAWAGLIKRLEAGSLPGEEKEELAPVYKRLRAIAFESMGKWNEAAEQYREIVEMSPESEYAVRALLRALNKIGDYQAMIPIYEKILNPQSKDYARDLFQMGVISMRIKNWQSSENYLKQSFAADSSLPETSLLLANLYQQDNKYEESNRYFLTYASQNPEQLRSVFDTFFSVALRTDNLEPLAELIEEIIDSKEAVDPWYLEQLGVVYFHQKRTDESLELLEPLYNEGRLGDSGYYTIGFLFNAKDNKEQAADAFNRLLKSRPDFGPVYQLLGQIYFSQSMLDSAAAVLKRGYEHVSEKDEVSRRELKFALANTYFEMKDYRSTEDVLKSLVAEYPDYHPALNYLGYLWADRNENLEKAKELIDKALTLDPQNGHYLDSLGWVLYRMGEYNEALIQIKNSLDIIGPHTEIYEHLGEVYRALGEVTLARENLSKALELEPDNTRIETRLEQLGVSANGEDRE